MPRRYLPLLEVRQNMRGWTVLLQVVEIGNVQYSHGTPPKKYKRFIFTDSQGVRVSAVIYGNDIRYFAALLQPFKRYYISNAIVRQQDQRYRVSEYEYSWIINNSTLVEEHEEPNPPTLPCTFQLAKFSELSKVADTENLLNVQAVVIHVFPPKEQGSNSTKDIVIINEEKKPMLLTLWNEFEENEGNVLANSLGNADVLLAMRVKVTTFNYLSLTTKIPTCLLINPPIPETHHLKDWYNANKEEVKQLIDQMAYKDSNRLLPVPEEEEDIISIEKALATLRNVKTAWIRGKPKLIPGQQRFWYTACMKCQKSVHADIEWTIRCPACKEETQVEARCRIAITLDDGTGSMNAVILGMDAEKLIPYTGLHLKEADDQDFSLATELATSIEKHKILFFVRHYVT